MIVAITNLEMKERGLFVTLCSGNTVCLPPSVRFRATGEDTDLVCFDTDTFHIVFTERSVVQLKEWLGMPDQEEPQIQLIQTRKSKGIQIPINVDQQDQPEPQEMPMWPMGSIMGQLGTLPAVRITT
jgi:hypothetical protein